MMHPQGKGDSRSTRTLVVLTLACVAGMVNATGFFAVGTYTSHVTGHASMVGDELAKGNHQLAWHFLLLVGFFVTGAFAAALFVEKAKRFGTARYSAALLVEAAILTAFTAISALVPDKGPNLRLVLTAMLSISMGLQNALVTRIAGAVVRTTHLTGIATDIGIELAKLVYWVRHNARLTAPLQFVLDFVKEEELRKLRVHLALFCAFLGGAIVGPTLYLEHGHAAMLLPGALLLGLVAFDQVPWERLFLRFRRRPQPVLPAEALESEERAG